MFLNRLAIIINGFALGMNIRLYVDTGNEMAVICAAINAVFLILLVMSAQKKTV